MTVKVYRYAASEPLTQLDDLSMLCHPTINVDRPATQQLIELARQSSRTLQTVSC